jgi:hypothetical protein
VSIPGFVSCRPVTLEEWELVPLKLTAALLKLFQIIRNL